MISLFPAGTVSSYEETCACMFNAGQGMKEEEEEQVRRKGGVPEGPEVYAFYRMREVETGPL